MSLSTSVVRTQSNALSKANLRILPPVVYAASASSVCATTPTIASRPSAACLNLSSHQELSPIWFNSSFPNYNLPSPSGGNPSDERKVKLGKTLRILQERLPTLLQSPLPQEILSPHISLHLFPSTHPYLPTVSGRVAYIAALWTSPLAWNRVPIIGNVKLEILSERMVSQPYYSSPKRSEAYGEQLVVKWRTADSKPKDAALTIKEDGEHKLDDTLRGTQSVGEKMAFTGLFIFEFDKDARVISHTIEHVDEHGDWERGLGARVVGLTDWLLGGIKGRSDSGAPALCSIVGKDRKNAR
ncbi:uncharacterized protein F4807DRAFT_54246 [Annulohypoxylon truncatum]|uniref:uncharacterized protein n=1 Tax=Annulohypoxylon truncatum TaxID=327061 RepID=UPI002008A137|nr:uncharacterized protein F4807DRAFT_54246 [Annulohypoxylon truncatum]KAI1210640.1 hypothetical protein F4807DRAFT_54246 [Annulohypoxylon truncatum]